MIYLTNIKRNVLFEYTISVKLKHLPNQNKRKTQNVLYNTISRKKIVIVFAYMISVNLKNLKTKKFKKICTIFLIKQNIQSQ